MQQPPNPYPQFQPQQQPNYPQPQAYYPPQQQWQQPPMPQQQQWNPQQQPFPPQEYQQPPQYQPPKKKSHKGLFIVLAVILAVVLFGCIGFAAMVNAGGQSAPTTQVTQPIQATQQPTLQPTTQPTTKPTTRPTQALAMPTPAASSDTSQANEFIKLVQISPVYGKVTDATINPQGQGKIGVAFDVTVNNPTQARVKHVSYEILSTILQVNNVSIANTSFHANGYTGMDDPIASDGATSGEVNWAALDDNSAWNATGGIFDANLPS